MLTYRVEDMTCGHCAGAITKAVQAVDANARVEVDLAQKIVRIEPGAAAAAKVHAAIAEAGYSPVSAIGTGLSASQHQLAGDCRSTIRQA